MQEKDETIVKINFCARNSFTHMKKKKKKINKHEFYLTKFMPNTKCCLWGINMYVFEVHIKIIKSNSKFTNKVFIDVHSRYV